MSTSTATVTSSVVLSKAEQEIDHTVCCLTDDSPTFCGLDGSVMAQAIGNEPRCVVCAEFEDGTDLCPFGGECTAP